MRWSLRRPEAEIGAAVATVLREAANDPKLALELADAALRQDPARASEHGVALILAFSQSDNFDAAMEFAVQGPKEAREVWLDSVFDLWSARQPAAAAVGALHLPTEALRRQYLAAAVSQWSVSSPAVSVEFANRLADPQERCLALDCTFAGWAREDPTAAAEWLRSQEPAAEWDDGLSVVVTRPEFASRHPLLAAGWAEDIIDPHLRSHAIAAIVQSWAQTDRSAAEAYYSNSRYLDVYDRDMLASVFAAVATSVQVP